MRFASFLAAALALAIAGPASAQSWEEYTNREDHFTVNFPGEPAVEKITYKTEKGTSLPGNVYTANLDGSNHHTILTGQGMLTGIALGGK